MEKQNQFLMKKQNKKLVLEMIKKNAPISRTKIAKLTSMSPTSISRIVNELHIQGFVLETELVTSGVGRKAMLLSINGNVIYTIGVELDTSVIKVAIVNYLGEIIDIKIIYGNNIGNYENTILLLVSIICEIIDQNKIPKALIIGIAVGLPGFIDYKNGIVKLSEQLLWKDKPLSEDLKRLTTFKVLIDNELKMKVIAEYFLGKAKGIQNAILVGIGSGIGSAIMFNGEIYRGESNNAGEIGHTVMNPKGKACHCGKFGCLTTYISEKAILSDSRKIKDLSSIHDVYLAYRRKEEWALQILDRTTTYISLALSNITSLYNPEMIILSGNLIDNLPEIKQDIEKKYEMYAWEPVKKMVRIVYSQLSNQGVILGGAIQVQNRFLVLE